MFAFDDLFRFTAKYPQLVAGDILSDIQHEAEGHLASKAYLGIFFIPLCFISASLIVDFHRQHLPFFIALLILFTVGGGLRFSVLGKICKKDIPNNRHLISLFVLSCCLSALTWGISAALFFYFYGASYPLYLMVMATCGICAGSLSSFASFRILVWLYMLLLTVPILVVGLVIADSQALGLVIVSTCFLVYMMFQADFRNKEYWNALIKSHLLVYQTEELKEVNRSLAQKMDEQQEVQQELKVSREKLRDIFDNSHNAIIIHGMDGLILDINRTMVEMFDIVDVEKLDISLLAELSAPGNSYTGFREMIDKVMLGKEANFEWYAKKQSSDICFWVQVNMRKVVWQNDPIIFSSIRNIDEQKRAELERDLVKKSLVKSEAYLHALLENITKPIFCKTPDGNYVIINRHFEALVNETNENIEGKDDHDLFDPVTAEKLAACDANVKTSKKPVDIEITLESEARQKSLLVSKFPLLDEQDELIAIGGICTDITTIKEAYDEVAKANREKGDYLANMAHELRTPMHGILSFARLAIKRMHTTSRENMLSYLHMVITSGEHLLDLLDNLIELNRYESDRIAYHFEEGLLVGELSEVVEDFRGAAEERQVTLKYTDRLSEKETKGLLLAYDPIRIQQVVRNLITNAIKFSPPGKTVEICADIESVDNSNDDVVLVKVTDQGSGIPENEAGLVFESYTRGNAARTSGIGGSGLGLAICKKVIEDHGGKIWVEQNPEGGAVFSFTLPFVP